MNNHLIAIAAGQRGIAVTAHLVLTGGQSAVLTPRQFEDLADLIDAGVVLDQGTSVADPTDATGSSAASGGGVVWLSGLGPPTGDPDPAPLDGEHDPYRFSQHWAGWASQAFEVSWEAGATTVALDLPDDRPDALDNDGQGSQVYLAIGTGDTLTEITNNAYAGPFFDGVDLPRSRWVWASGLGRVQQPGADSLTADTAGTGVAVFLQLPWLIPGTGTFGVDGPSYPDLDVRDFLGAGFTVGDVYNLPAPAPIGEPGNMYVDSVNRLLYGPKVGDDWGTPVNVDTNTAAEVAALQATVDGLSVETLTSPNQTVYRIVVDDAGMLGTEAVG